MLTFSFTANWIALTIFTMGWLACTGIGKMWRKHCCEYVEDLCREAKDYPINTFYGDKANQIVDTIAYGSALFYGLAGVCLYNLVSTIWTGLHF